MAARHDADRHAAEVLDAVRVEALARWRADSGWGAKRRICDGLQIARPTLDEWIAAANS